MMAVFETVHVAVVAEVSVVESWVGTMVGVDGAVVLANTRIVIVVG